MRNILIIATFLLGAVIFERADFAPTPTMSQFEISDTHHEQLECCHRHNIDAERTSTVVVPSVRTTSASSLRQAQQRIFHFVVAERIASTNYPTIRFIHRLGCCARAVDFYLYILCQLRL